jgi:hypothetical protein
MGTRYAFSPEFWAQFVGRYWEKKPLVLKKPFAAGLVTSKEIFRTLANAGSQEREDWGFRFYVEQALQEAEMAKHLPALSDGSLSGYAERVTRGLKGRRFCLVVDHYHKHDVQTWLRLREFLRGLYGVVGIPVPLSLGAIFMSNYERSPFGVHKDRHGAFTFVVEGGKRILAWPDEVFRDRSDVSGSLDYKQFLRKAIRLEGKPGDVIYWPSSYWHAAESIGGLSLTLAVPVFPQFDGGSDIFSLVTKTVESRLKTTEEMRVYSSHPDRLQKSADKASKVVKLVLKTLRDTSRSAELGRDLRIAWLNRVTSGGFASVPAPRPYQRLKDDDVVRGDPLYPVVWLPLGDDEIICSANGHCFSICAHPNILKLLKRLNSGETLRMQRIVAEYPGTAWTDGTKFEALAEDIRALVEKLYSLRAITINGQPVDSTSCSSLSSSVRKKIAKR